MRRLGGHAEVVRAPIERGADVEAFPGADRESERDGRTPLYQAAYFGHLNVLRVLLEKKAVSKDRPVKANRMGPLHVACDQPEALAMLLDAGVDVNQQATAGVTPLSLATRWRCPEAVTVILKYQPNLEVEDETNHLTPLELAAATREVGQNEILTSLLEAGARVPPIGARPHKFSPLHSAVARGDDDLIRTLLQFSPRLDVDARDHDGDTALHCISKRSSLACVQRMVWAGAKLNLHNNAGEPPLYRSIDADNPPASKLLIRHARGDNLNGMLKPDRNPLIVACCRMDAEVVTLLLDAGAKPKLPNEGWFGPPVQSACLRWDGSAADAKAILEVLLRRGACLDEFGGQHGYALMAALFAGPPSVVSFLLEKGARIDVRDIMGRNPAHRLGCRSLEILQTLRELPDALLAKPDKLGRVPLHCVGLSGDVGLFREIYRRSCNVGIDVHVTDPDNWTPLHWAARVTRRLSWAVEADPADTIEFLILKGADLSAKGKMLNQEVTPLGIAKVYKASERIIRLLTPDAGADPRNLIKAERTQTDTSCDGCFQVSTYWTIARASHPYPKYDASP
jgi:ankyrin repeat protein